MENIACYIDTQSISQRVFLTTPDIPNGSAILFTHGWTADSSAYQGFAEACAANTGAICLAVDLLGHGQSEGDRNVLSITEYVEGLKKAYDYLKGQPQVDNKRIGTMAGSFGAYLTVLLAAERPVKSLLLRVPALYPDELRDMPRYAFDTEVVLHTEPDPGNTALQIVRKFLGKVVLVSSGLDEIILPGTIEAYSQAIRSGEHIVMPGASHVLDEQNAKVFRDILMDWAREL